MINNNNTYTTTTRYNLDGDVTFQEEFSKGEFLTEEDLDLIARRSRTFYMKDEEYERFLEEESTYIPEANINNYAFGDSLDGRFKIGNNLPSAE